MTVALDKRFYTLSAVEETVEAFEHLAEISVKSSSERITLTFGKIDPDVEDVLVDEFLNYALATTISNRGS